MGGLLLVLLLVTLGVGSRGQEIRRESVYAKQADIQRWISRCQNDYHSRGGFSGGYRGGYSGGYPYQPEPTPVEPTPSEPTPVEPTPSEPPPVEPTPAAPASQGTTGTTGIPPTVTVDCNGGGNYKTVKEGIDGLVSRLSSVSGKPVLYIKNCKYTEKLEFPSSLKNAIIKGESADGVSLEFGDTARSVGGSTFNSASVIIAADDLIVANITFRNTAGYHDPSINDLQGVALRVSSDRVAFFGCKFYGYQDTLYDHQGRHYFRDCYIEGSIDFVFGNGQSIYESCTLNSPYQGSFSAQKRATPEEKTGFVFLRSQILGDGLMRLARAWGEYSRVVFAYCYIDDTINTQEPFSDFGFPDRQSKVFFGEYKNTGPGAVVAKRNTWTGTYILTDEQAAPFLSLDFIDGSTWLSTNPPDIATSPSPSPSPPPPPPPSPPPPEENPPPQDQSYSSPPPEQKFPPQDQSYFSTQPWTRPPQNANTPFYWFTVRHWTYTRKTYGWRCFWC